MYPSRIRFPILFLTAFVAMSTLGHAETGAAGWLRYSPLLASERQRYALMPNQIVSLDDDAISKSATAELQRGLHEMLGRDLISSKNVAGKDAIVIGTVNQIHTALRAGPRP